MKVETMICNAEAARARIVDVPGRCAGVNDVKEMVFH